MPAPMARIVAMIGRWRIVGVVGTVAVAVPGPIRIEPVVVAVGSVGAVSLVVGSVGAVSLVVSDIVLFLFPDAVDSVSVVIPDIVSNPISDPDSPRSQMGDRAASTVPFLVRRSPASTVAPGGDLARGSRWRPRSRSVATWSDQAELDGARRRLRTIDHVQLG